MGTKQISWLSGFSATGDCEAAGDFAHFLLGEFAEGKIGARELFLREAEKKIGLVLGFVDGAQEFVAAGFRIVANARVVAGGDAFGADLARGGEELIELHVIVAERAWNRRAAGEIIVDEGPDHGVFEFALEIDHVIRECRDVRLRGGRRRRRRSSSSDAVRGRCVSSCGRRR